VTREGELHFFVLQMGASTGIDACHVGSREGRTRWHSPNLLSAGSVGLPRSAIELDSGRILYPFDHALAERDTHHPTDMSEATCAYSDIDADR